MHKKYTPSVPLCFCRVAGFVLHSPPPPPCFLKLSPLPLPLRNASKRQRSRASATRACSTTFGLWQCECMATCFLFATCCAEKYSNKYSPPPSFLLSFISPFPPGCRFSFFCVSAWLFLSMSISSIHRLLFSCALLIALDPRIPVAAAAPSFSTEQQEEEAEAPPPGPAPSSSPPLWRARPRRSASPPRAPRGPRRSG